MAKLPVAMIDGLESSAPIVTDVGTLILSNTTPNGRIDYGVTDSGTYSVGAGCMAVCFDFVGSNYFTTQTGSHTAFVLRQDMSLVGSQVRGQGAIIGFINGDTVGRAYPETWFNGVGAGNYVYATEHASPSDFPLIDGQTYRMWVESIVKEDGNRYLRYAIWKYATSTSKWELGIDTGFILDNNFVFDATKNGFIIGQVLASTSTAWSLTFSNVKIIWSKQSVLGFASNGTEVPGAVPALNYYDGSAVTEALKLTGGVASVLNNARPGNINTPVVAVKDYRGNSTVGLAGTNGNAIKAIMHTNTVQAESAWPLVAIGYNNSTAAACGVVGGYLQVNNRATGVIPGSDGYGGCWGSVSEVCDETYGTERNKQLFGTEIDCWVSGDQPHAIGAMIVVGDSKEIRTGVASADARAATGIVVKSGSTQSRWKTGVAVTDYSEDGLVVYNYNAYPYTGLHPTRGITVQGTHTSSMLSLRFCSAPIGIDMSDSATLTTAIKFGSGQKLDFGTGYPTWPSWTNTALPGAYDCSTTVPNDLATHSSVIYMILQVLGHLMNEHKSKGVLK